MLTCAIMNSDVFGIVNKRVIKMTKTWCIIFMGATIIKGRLEKKSGS